MKKSHLRVLVLAGLVPVFASACAQNATIKLYDHIAGPAVHVHSTTLLESGSVVFNEYNITNQKDRATDGVSTLCRMPSATAASVAEQAFAITSGLPSVVDPNEPQVLDGPFRSITIRKGEREFRSTSSSYDSPKSKDAKRFLAAWHQLEQLLSCHGPNNSFKPTPLRGAA